MNELTIYWRVFMDSVYMVAELKKLDAERFFHIGMEVSAPPGVEPQKAFEMVRGDMLAFLCSPIAVIDANYLVGRGPMHYMLVDNFNKCTAKHLLNPIEIADGLIELDKKFETTSG